MAVRSLVQHGGEPNPRIMGQGKPARTNDVSGTVTSNNVGVWASQKKPSTIPVYISRPQPAGSIPCPQPYTAGSTQKHTVNKNLVAQNQVGNCVRSEACAQPASARMRAFSCYTRAHRQTPQAVPIPCPPSVQARCRAGSAAVATQVQPNTLPFRIPLGAMRGA